jgi:hypothetical protein
LSGTVPLLLCQGCAMAVTRFFVYLIGMTIDDFMHALERAWACATPGREAVERDHVLRELRRRLEAEPRPSAPLRVRLIRSSA